CARDNLDYDWYFDVW
nr:immunoglobulin heavy chain junction region [Mus musculus]